MEEGRKGKRNERGMGKGKKWEGKEKSVPEKGNSPARFTEIHCSFPPFPLWLSHYRSQFSLQLTPTHPTTPHWLPSLSSPSHSPSFLVFLFLFSPIFLLLFLSLFFRLIFTVFFFLIFFFFTFSCFFFFFLESLAFNIFSTYLSFSIPINFIYLPLFSPYSPLHPLLIFPLNALYLIHFSLHQSLVLSSSFLNLHFYTSLLFPF